MKRLILGKGKVSNIIKKDTDTILSRKDCDITDILSIQEAICEYAPDIVINCAAKTNLEYCQDFKIESFKSNTSGVLNVVESCKRYGIKLVHISSGCLFDGNDFISTEETEPSPAVWYTWTKKWADEIIQNSEYDNYLILRPRQLISKVPHKSNMITKFLSLKEIGAIHEPNSLTCIEDFSLMIDHLLSIDAKGIYNCANTGVVSPHDIALMIKSHIDPGLIVRSVSYERLLENLPNRRVNTILCTKKLENTGYIPRSASDALKWCVENYEK